MSIKRTEINFKNFFHKTSFSKRSRAPLSQTLAEIESNDLPGVFDKTIFSKKSKKLH